uniref:Ig-like domain-containing protein n=1 Tax=Takifugu rubripes TaxID=31033 RepID=A0A3B5K602_TAKRU
MRCQCTASNYLHSATKEFIIVVVKPSTAVPPAAITTPEAVPQSACPVILTPAEVVVRFGDPLSINCSTSAANVKEIDFIVSFGKKQVEQPLSVSWAVEEVKEWDVNAECFVTLEQNQCFKMPNVIVYKTPDSVSVSAGVTQEGAEMVLSCDVTNVAPLQALRVKWYRGNDMVHTQMLNDTSRTPASAVSTFRTAVMREDNGVEFRCAAELHLGPNGPELVPTVTSSAYTAVVLSCPVILTPAEVVVRFGDPLSINCSTSAANVKEIDFIVSFGKKQVEQPLSVSWAVEEVKEWDVNAECFVTLEQNQCFKMPNVIVYKTPDSVSVSAGVTQEGAEMVLSCDVTNVAPLQALRVKWYRGNDMVHTQMLNDTSRTPASAVSTFRTAVMREDNGVEFRCAAELHLGPNGPELVPTVTSSAYTAVVLCGFLSFHPSLQFYPCPVILTPAEVVVRFGDPLSINCSTSAANVKEIDFIVSFGKKQVEQPLSVSWAVEEVKEWDVNAECFVTLEQNQCSEMPNVIVYKTPDSVSVSAGVTQEGAEMVLSCDVTNVAPLQALRVKWYRGNDMVHTQMFNDTSRTPASAVSTLRNTAVREDNGVEFRCAAELHLGPNGPELVPTVTSSAYTAVVLCGFLSFHPSLQLPCHVDGNPPPTVQWYHGGTAISASVPLTRTGSGEYTAEVVNSLGKSSTSVYITVEYSPSFTCNQHYEIKEDAQVQSVCEPDGLPPPIITWTKDGAVIPTPPRWTKHDSGNYSLTATNKHGTRSHWLYLNVLFTPRRFTQERIIRITGATSTNAGVYVCVAKSKAGRVTRSVTLSRVPPEVLWLLPLLLIIIILLVVLLYRTCKKKHGEYRFVADRAKDGSDVSIPLTTKHKGVQA